jgi:hypothetical protein
LKAQAKADAPQLWDPGLDWWQIELGIGEGGPEKPDQPMGTDREKLSETPERVRQ